MRKLPKLLPEEQALLVQLRLAPETVIPVDYSKWCKATKLREDYHARCHRRMGHSGPHMTGKGLDWDQFNKTVIVSPISRIIFWKQ